jgi:hypothetical protein
MRRVRVGKDQASDHMNAYWIVASVIALLMLLVITNSLISLETSLKKISDGYGPDSSSNAVD